MKFFPMDAGITEIRGILEIIKDSGGEISLAQLSDKAGEEIDKLLPLLEAGSLLGLVKIKEGRVNLTQRGKELSLENLVDVLSNALLKIEPFRTAMKILKEKGAMSTLQLVKELRKNHVKLYTDISLDIEAERRLLLRWGVRSRLFDYNYDTDTWSTPS